MKLYFTALLYRRFALQVLAVLWLLGLSQAGFGQALTFNANPNNGINPPQYYVGVVQNGFTAQNATIRKTITGGTTVVNLSSNQTWAIVPATVSVTGIGVAGSTFTIAIDATGLAVGNHTATISASAPGFTSSNVLTVNLTVADKDAAGSTAVNISFQSAGGALKYGFFRSSADAYGLQNGAGEANMNYGWTFIVEGVPPLGGATYYTTAGYTLDTLQRGRVQMQNPTNEKQWDIDLPNGLYEVSFSVGDAEAPAAGSTTRYTHNLNIEGINVVRYQTPATSPAVGAATRFRTGTAVVNVTDGKLTIDSRSGTQTRINYVIIKPAVAKLVFIPTTVAASFSKNLSSGSTLNNIKANFGNPTDIVLTSSQAWLTASAVNTTTGDFTLNYDISSLPVGFHTATITASATGYADVVLLVELTVTPLTMAFEVVGDPTPATPDISITTGYEVNPADVIAQVKVTDGGTPQFDITKSAGASWLILPSPSTGLDINTDYTFSFDLTGLPPGTHQAIVTASAIGPDAGNYGDAKWTISLTVTPFTMDITEASLTFTATQGDDGIASQTATLTAVGTPTSILFSKPTEATWLILPPTPIEGANAIGVDIGGLAPGVYETILTATSPGYNTTILPIKVVVNPKITWDDPTAWLHRINFQRDATPAAPATGYIVDRGLSYRAQLGFTFGWINPNDGNPFNNQKNTEGQGASTGLPRLISSWNYTQHPIFGSFNWEIAVPNGLYNVLVSTGDTDLADGNHHLNVEGVNAIDNFVPTTANLNKQGLVTVNVTDGKLTLDSDNGGRETKINFVNIGTANPVNDNIKPTIAVKFDGTTTSTQSAIYKDKVLVNVTVTDAGGADIDSSPNAVTFSLDNGTTFTNFSLAGRPPHKPFSGGFLLSEVGKYQLIVTARDGNGNSEATAVYNFEIVRVVKNNTKLSLQNLDKFPANDQLSFSRIQNDDNNYTGVPLPENGFPTAPNPQGHETVSIRLRNTGIAPLRVDSLILSDAENWKIDKLTGATYNAATMLPLTIQPGQFADLTLKFIAEYGILEGPPGGRIPKTDNIAPDTIMVGVLHETLTIVSNDDDDPRKPVYLNGLWMRADEGFHEPSLNEIIETFNMRTVNGFPGENGRTKPKDNYTPNGDEVVSANWKVADPGKPIYVRQMSAFHSCCVAVARLYYNKPGMKYGAQLLNHSAADGNTILPRVNGASGLPSEKSFFPSPSNTSAAGEFNFTIVDDCTDNTLNLNNWVGIRVFKARDAKGDVIPFAFILSMDYLSNTSNGDYNDNTYYIENIRPATGTAFAAVLGTDISEALFAERAVDDFEDRSITLTNLGSAIDADPAITIRSIEIAGDDFEDFSIDFPALSTLTAGSNTTMNVTFNPKTTGLKNAELLIYYNAANSILTTNSPRRIPLYGIATSSCVAVGYSLKIKSAAVNASDVPVGTEMWKSDVPYRKGKIKLDHIDDFTTSISDTDRDELYRSYLSSTQEKVGYRYDIPVAVNGTYYVRLHFAENTFTTIGSRINSYLIENELRLPGLDIFGEVGFKTALTKEFEVNVADGLLTIEVVPSVNRPALCGVEIYRFDQTPTFTLVEVVDAQPGVADMDDDSEPAACATDNGKIKVQVTGGVVSGTMTFRLGKFGEEQTVADNVDGLDNGIYPYTFPDLIAGEYVIYTQDATGCEVSQTFIVPESNNTLSATLTLTPVNCDANSNGIARAVPSGGVGTYTYIWNDNPELTTQTVSNLPVGQHFVRITDNNGAGCSILETFIITKEPGCPIRINTGGNDYITSTGIVFESDQFFSAGNTFETTTNVTGTTEATLYQTERFNNGNFNYRIPVANGQYSVILHFAEIRNGILATQRRFNVSIEGALVLDNFDIADETGSFKATIQSFNALISDNYVDIVFTKVAGSPKISAIEIIPVDVENVAPTAGTIPNQTVPILNPFAFTIGSSIFQDPGDVLTFTATLSDNSALPNWIIFNPATRTFNTYAPGPATPAVGSFINVKVRATDSYGAFIERIFTVTMDVATDLLNDASASQSERPLLKGSKKRRILSITLDAGSATSLIASELTFNANGTTDISKIQNAELFSTGNDELFIPTVPNKFGSTVSGGALGTNFTFTGNQLLSSGINYFWLSYDIDPTAELGESFDAEFISALVGGQTYLPSDGTPSGARIVSETGMIPGNAIDLQGTSNRLEIANSIDIPANFTLEFWLNPRENTATERWIIGEVGGMRITQQGTLLRFYVVNSSGTLSSPATAALDAISTSIEQWHHIAATFDGATLNLYVNGKAGTSANFAFANVDRNDSFLMGGLNAGNQNNIQLDEVRLWNVARNVQTIRENMHLTLTGLETNLVNYWQFDEEDTAVEAKDLVGDRYGTRSNPALTNWIEATEPVGGGISHTKTISGATTEVFTNTDVQITFGSTNPAGDVVVTKIIGLAPYQPTDEDLENPEPTVNDGRPKTASYWVINNFGINTTLSPMTLRFSNIESSFYNAGTISNFYLNKRSSTSTGAWSSFLTSNIGTTPSNFIEFNDITSFSQAVITVGAASSTPLPVTLVSFKGKRVDVQTNELEWITIREENNLGFEIEKSTDNARTFERIGFVEGSGNAAQLKTYTFRDQDAAESAYYRLKQIDIDGQFAYSGLIFIQGNTTADKITIAPNPAIGEIHFVADEALQKEPKIMMTVHTSSGEPLLTASGTLQELEKAINHRLKYAAQGLYLVRFVSSNRVQAIKLLKQ